MMDESNIEGLFHHLDMAVMERMNDGSLQLTGDIPECLRRFFPDVPSGMRGFRPEEEFPFLENFLFDAEEWWTTGNTEKLKSGPWIETDPWGNECEFEATALSLGKRKILIIEMARYSYEEKQAFIQKSRELRLAYHHLAKAEAEVKKAKEIAEDANQKLLSSIRYAKTIQRSLLPNPENISHFLPNSFFLWMPRDIVSGDFIFTARVGEGVIVAMIDCTGHGVPGAFMTMIASSGLKQIITDESIYDPADILKRLSAFVKTTLHQDTDYALSDDGLDAAICFVSCGLSVAGCPLPVANCPLPVDSGPFSVAKHPTDNTLQPATCKQQATPYTQLIFAGAKQPLIYFHHDELIVIKGDRQSLGYKRSDVNFDYTNHTIPIEKGMSFYMLTDGFADQHGGDESRRFGTRRFRNLLKENAHLPFDKQRERLLQAFHEYKGEKETRDDVTVVGFGF